MKAGGLLQRRVVFWGAVAAMLASMAAVQFVTMLQETQTWDESIHLSAGYSYLKTGDYKLNREHPPLFKLLAALAILPLDPVMPVDHKSWETGDQIAFGDYFLYGNRVHAETLLQRARCVTVALTMLLGVSIAWWTRRRFGAAPALLATFLFAFDPNFIAHGRYVTSDLIAALFIFLTIATWSEYLLRPSMARLAAAGAALGLALVSKFTAVFLLPVLLALYLFRWWQIGRRKGLSIANLALAAVVMTVISLTIIGICYGPETIRSFRGPDLLSSVDNSTIIGKTLRFLGRYLSVPSHPYFMGLGAFAEHSRSGHRAYLLGQLSEKGWWYYFPVVVAVKTPTGFLLLMAAAVAAAIATFFSARAWRGAIERLRGAPLAWIASLLTAGLYFGLSMNSNVNLGVRHILPVYPFLFALASAAVLQGFSGRLRRAAAALAIVCAALVAVESARIYPYYLAFFNTPSGGPERGPDYLVDSNIDWGQDMRRLRQHLDSIGWKEQICFSYFGRASMWYYGLNAANLPNDAEVRAGKTPDCLAAISVTQLHEVYAGESTFSWLRERTPIAKVGYSIYLYDARKHTFERPPR